MQRLVGRIEPDRGQRLPFPLQCRHLRDSTQQGDQEGYCAGRASAAGSRHYRHHSVALIVPNRGGMNARRILGVHACLSVREPSCLPQPRRRFRDDMRSCRNRRAAVHGGHGHFAHGPAHALRFLAPDNA